MKDITFWLLFSLLPISVWLTGFYYQNYLIEGIGGLMGLIIFYLQYKEVHKETVR